MNLSLILFLIGVLGFVLNRKNIIRCRSYRGDAGSGIYIFTNVERHRGERPSDWKHHVRKIRVSGAASPQCRRISCRSRIFLGLFGVVWKIYRSRLMDFALGTAVAAFSGGNHSCLLLVGQVLCKPLMYIFMVSSLVCPTAVTRSTPPTSANHRDTITG